MGGPLYLTGRGKTKAGTGRRSLEGSTSVGGGSLQSPFSRGAAAWKLSRGAGKDQMTSVSTSSSSLFFCFFITASSSDTFSLSWSRGGKSGRWRQSPQRPPPSGLGDERLPHLQQRALHCDLAVHARPLLGAQRPELLFLQRE